jgi:hypothetical protein
VGFPRDIDIRSGAFVLFAFVVVIIFGGFVLVSVACRFGVVCGPASTGLIDTIKSLTENIISILLALMVGTRPPPTTPGEKPDAVRLP